MKKNCLQKVHWILIFSSLLMPASLYGADKNDNSAAQTETEKAAESRLSENVKKLSSDSWEGRGIGTKGIDEAANFVADQFRAAGLKTEIFDGKPFQYFSVTTSSKIGPDEKNKLNFVSDSDSKPISLVLNKDYRPLSVGGSATFDLPIAFVGYGISSKDDHYDDYEGIDVTDKAVIIMRHEPQQNNPHSSFDGTENSIHANTTRKISNAYQHGAAAVLLVTDDFSIQDDIKNEKKEFAESMDKLSEENEQLKKIPESDQAATAEHLKKVASLVNRLKGLKLLAKDKNPDVLMPFQTTDVSESRRMPVMHVRREFVDKVLKQALDTNLSELENQIDKDLKPQSKLIAKWKIQGETNVIRVESQAKNVIGVLEGIGSQSDETIVIGAHYDHLGHGGYGSFDKESKEIHNGADDNASGTAALIETARQMVKRGNQPRRIVFIAFSGEERGLLGSAYYVHHPVYPLEKTIAMLNMDMVGRLKDNNLIVSGYNTAKEFETLITKLNETYKFKIERDGGGHGPSDHASFYAVGIPVMHYFTGLHSDYHRPTDDFDKLDIHGMRRVTSMMVDTAVAIASTEQKPQFTKAPTEKFKQKGTGTPKNARPYFGSIPDLSSKADGYELQDVTKGSPADLGGVKAKDIIINVGGNKVETLADFDSALRKFKEDDIVDVTVNRGGEEVKLKVTLGKAK